MNNIEKIIICFKAGEKVVIPVDHIGYFKIAKIREEYNWSDGFFEANTRELIKTKIADTIIIELLPIVQNMQCILNDSNEYTDLSDRLINLFDIAYIVLVDNVHKEDVIFVDWNEKYNTFNKNQKTMILDNSNILIVIDKDKNCFDYKD